MEAHSDEEGRCIGCGGSGVRLLYEDIAGEEHEYAVPCPLCGFPLVSELRKALYQAALSSDPADGLVLDHQNGLAFIEGEPGQFCGSGTYEETPQ